MKTITFLNSKGGVGKSTLCFNIAQGILEQSPNVIGPNILLVDADPQGTMSDWHNLNNSGMNLITADKKQSLMSAHSMARSAKVDYMLIDTAGRMHENLGTALTLSHLAVIPLKPSPLDVWATIDVIDLVKARMLINPTLKSIFIINQAIVGSSLTLDVCCALAEAEAIDIDLVKSVIHGRISFARTASNGLTVFHSKDEQAKSEIRSLTNEILARLL